MVRKSRGGFIGSVCWLEPTITMQTKQLFPIIESVRLENSYWMEDLRISNVVCGLNGKNVKRPPPVGDWQRIGGCSFKYLHWNSRNFRNELLFYVRRFMSS